MRIVYLDDEPELCEMFSDLFAAPDLEIETFVDPEDAVRSIQARRPDLIFLDYRLPHTTGDGIARRLDPSIPKVLVTGDIAVKTDYPFLEILAKPYLASEGERIIAGVRGTV